MGILLTPLLYGVLAELQFRLLLEITTFSPWHCICMHGLLLELGTTQMDPVELLCGGKTLLFCDITQRLAELDGTVMRFGLEYN